MRCTMSAASSSPTWMWITWAVCSSSSKRPVRRVACHTVEKEYLEHPERRKPAAFWMQPVYAVVRRLPQFRINPVTPDELMVDGQRTPEGFTVVHTPGHTPGHISLLHKERRLLIMGDAMQNRKHKLDSPPALFTPDMQNAQRSIWKLAKKHGDDFEVVVFGHGEPILQNGGKRIKGYVSQALLHRDLSSSGVNTTTEIRPCYLW